MSHVTPAWSLTVLPLVNGGGNSAQGRVELNFDGQIIGVCATGLPNSVAKVICMHLGYAGGRVVKNDPYGLPPAGMKFFTSSGFSCPDAATDINQCSFKTILYNHKDCLSGSAGVQCTESLGTASIKTRFENGGGNAAQGRLEMDVVIDGAQQTVGVCATGLDNNVAKVLCRQNKYAGGRIVKNNPYGVPPSGMMMLTSKEFYCKGTETNVGQCFFRSDLYEPDDCLSGSAGIQCTESLGTGSMQVNFANGGGNAAQGRLELTLSIYGSQQTVGVCATGLTKEIANVICHQKGYADGGKILKGNPYGLPPSGMMMLTSKEFYCKGTESNIGQCFFRTDLYEPDDCLSGSAGVQCSGNSNGGPSTPSTTKCEGCETSAPEKAGYRRVVAIGGIGVYKERSLDSTKLAGFKKCSRIYWTGIKNSSTAGEDICYAEIDLQVSDNSNRWGWAPLNRCGSTTANIADDQTTDCCPKCKPAKGTPGDRYVSEPFGVYVFKEPCAKSAQITALSYCTEFYWAGDKIPSSCGEDICYALVDLGADKKTDRWGWIQLQGCRSATATAKGKIPAKCVEKPQIPPIPTIEKNQYAKDFVKRINGLVDNSGGAATYVERAKAQNCVDSRFDTVAKVKNALYWNNAKLEILWKESASLSAKYGITLDPRLLMAILVTEGTGSFDTCPCPTAKDGQHGLEPDFNKDIRNAVRNHAMGKLLAYPHYGSAFSKASKAKKHSPPENNSYRVKYNSLGSCTTIKYTKKGDIFEYMNNKVPRIVQEDSTGKLGVCPGFCPSPYSYGPYACAEDWESLVRSNYETYAGSGLAEKYDRYLRYAKAKGLEGVSWPAMAFAVMPSGQRYDECCPKSGKLVGGFPVLMDANTGGCGLSTC